MFWWHKAKIKRQRPSGKLQPLKIPQWKYDNILMNFVAVASFLVFGFQIHFLKQNTFGKNGSEMIFNSISYTFTLFFKTKKKGFVNFIFI